MGVTGVSDVGSEGQVLESKPPQIWGVGSCRLHRSLGSLSRFSLAICFHLNHVAGQN